MKKKEASPEFLKINNFNNIARINSEKKKFTHTFKLGTLDEMELRSLTKELNDHAEQKIIRFVDVIRCLIRYSKNLKHKYVLLNELGKNL